MSINRTFLAATAAVLCASIPARAQEAGAGTYNHLEKADVIAGMSVVDSRDQHVGKVVDVAIDWEAGRVAEMLVDTGGFLTSHSRVVAVPPQCFNFGVNSNELRMTADLDAFDSAPEFNISEWNDATVGGQVTDVYKRFHVLTYNKIGRLERGEKLTGLPVRNQHNERLAKVDFLAVDLPSGVVPDVILTTFGTLTAAPPEAFYFEPDYDALVLDVTKEALKKAPHFKEDEWRSAINRPMNLSGLSNSFKQLRALGDNSKNQVVPAIAQPIGVMPVRETVAPAPGDSEITTEIERKILAAEGLSMDARRVLVLTQKGWVTLRGMADSVHEKDQLGGIAASVVPSDHVKNEVQVRMFADADSPNTIY
jgi:hypothetical protein